MFFFKVLCIISFLLTCKILFLNSFIAILVAAICGAMPWWALAVVIALKPALDNCRAMLKLPTEGMKALIGVDEKTAQLQLMFSLLLSISLFVTAAL